MNTALLEQVRTARRDYPFLPIKTAVEIARYEGRESTRYPFLNEMASWPAPGDEPLVGEVDGVTVTVALLPDEDTNLGDDDVTGWFTDEYEPGCIKNTRRNWDTDYKWYHPAKTRLSEDSGWRWYWKHEGMSKAEAREFVRQLIVQDMKTDADRTYVLMHVKLTVAGREIASGYLGGIDIGADATKSRAYLIETAEEQIDEAFDQARRTIDKKIKRAAGELAALRAVRNTLKEQSE